ncbi:MAG: Maf family protein [Proteobacteria bacterium]|nr:Maf family protein [Pseudomonadota bacterium]
MTANSEITNDNNDNNAINIVLASTSQFRQQLLEAAGIKFVVVSPRVDEKSIANFPPAILAAKRAALKGREVASRMPSGSLIIGADQVLGMNGKSFDKASTLDEAVERLKGFSGKTHTLYSAVILLLVGLDRRPELVFETVVEVPMEMRALSDQEIQEYVATGEWQGCVGCYRIEGLGAALFSRVGGDQSAIIGLPMKVLVPELTKIFGVRIP